MAIKGDTNRVRSIKAEFDGTFEATSHGGAAILEQAMRRLDVRGLLAKHLPSRGRAGGYSAGTCARAAIAGMLCGGKGFRAAESLRADPVLARIFGFESVPEEATQYRAMCDLAGLPQREFSQTYECVEKEPRLPALDMFGAPRAKTRFRRIVPEIPEAMDAARVLEFSEMLESSARACIEALNIGTVRIMGFAPVHGDASDVEVEGACFDAAAVNHEGKKSLRWVTVKLGPVTMAQEVMPGASDEGTNLPRLLERAERNVLKAACGAAKRLGLLDGAYCEANVLAKLRELRWDYIVGANQMRDVLTRVAEERPAGEWKSTGADAGRGWRESEVCVFLHRAGTWAENETVVCRRWQNEDEIGVWNHAFVVTSLEPGDLPKDKLKEHGYAELVWMLYGTKQGHENHYKSTLIDLGLHHPPSGRLGAVQAHYALGSVAANIFAVVSYKVVPAAKAGPARKKKGRGMRLATFLREYVLIPARTVWSAGRTLLVRLAGAGLAPERQTRWLEAFANARRI